MWLNMRKKFVSFALMGLGLFWPFELPPAGGLPVSFDALQILSLKPLASEELDLTSRYADAMVNEVMADNILLTLRYLKGDVSGQPDWQKVKEPFTAEFTLKPGEIFAFQDNFLPEFKDKVVKTTAAHFNYDQGFKSDGWLIGDGVCHLASLINWAAKEAQLEVVAKVNHDFYPIPGVPKEYGTSIFWSPDGSRGSASQNLYIENSLDFPVTFTFKAQASRVELLINK